MPIWWPPLSGELHQRVAGLENRPDPSRARPAGARASGAPAPGGFARLPPHDQHGLLEHPQAQRHISVGPLTSWPIMPARARARGRGPRRVRLCFLQRRDQGHATSARDTSGTDRQRGVGYRSAARGNRSLNPNSITSGCRAEATAARRDDWPVRPTGTGRATPFRGAAIAPSSTTRPRRRSGSRKCGQLRPVVGRRQ